MGRKVKVQIPLNDWGNYEVVDMGQYCVSETGDRTYKPVLLLDEPLHDDTAQFQQAMKRVEIMKLMEYN